MERLPGFRDFYPEPLPHSDVWSAERRASTSSANGVKTASRYGFREYDGPPLETLELFTTKSGEENRRANSTISTTRANAPWPCGRR